MLKQFDIIAVGPSLQLGKHGKTLSTDANGLLVNGNYVPAVINLAPTSTGPDSILISDLHSGVINRLTQDTMIGTDLIPAGSLLVKSADGLSYNNISDQTGSVATPVTWDIKTANHTCAGSENLLIDSTVASFDVTLPASPAINTIVRVAPLFPSYSYNPVTVLRNGELINGGTSDILLNQNGASFELHFYGGAIGWVFMNRGDTTIVNAAGVLLPNDDTGYLTNDGSGSLRWSQYIPYGLIKVVDTTFMYDAGTFTIVSFPYEVVITSCSVKVVTEFAGNPTIAIGTLASPTDILGINVADLKTHGTYNQKSIFDVAISEDIVGFLSGGTGAGEARVLLEYYIPRPV